jgi:hypothetical protein
VVAYGQWNLARPADKERMEVAPPLRETSNPLSSPGGGRGGGGGVLGSTCT